LGEGLKALVKINNKPIVEYIIEALRNCPLVDKIAIVGPFEILNRALIGKVDYIIEGRGSIVENIIKGIDGFDYNSNLLICTSDIPLLTSEAVLDFVMKAIRTRADFCYPIVEKSKNKKLFPGIERTYVRLREGSFTGGNIFYIKPERIKACAEKANELIASRKNPTRMAKILGLKVLVGFILGRLTIASAEIKFSRVFGIKAKAIISDFPELANDIDKPSHLEYITRRQRYLLPR
jgi:GTP:adenosylcobinamide-phosphate guanylyltransferase